MTRAEILDAAKQCVCGQREQDYGTPESNFQLIADLWNSYLNLPYNHSDANETRATIPEISPTDVAMMMALMKIARIKNGGGTGDSFVDLAGYAACGGEINSCKQFSIRDLQNAHICSNCKYKMIQFSEYPCDTCIHNCESQWPKKTDNWEKRDD